MDPSCSMNTSNLSKAFTDTPPLECINKVQGTTTINEETQTEEVMIIENPNPTPISECITDSEQIMNLALLGLRPAMKHLSVISNNESECLDRRKPSNGSECHYLTDIPNLERIERADFSKENALINVNHASIINVLGLIEDSDNNSSRSIQNLLKTSSLNLDKHHEKLNGTYLATSTPRCAIVSENLFKQLECIRDNVSNCSTSVNIPRNEEIISFGDKSDQTSGNAQKAKERSDVIVPYTEVKTVTTKSPPLSTTPRSIFVTNEIPSRKSKICSSFSLNNDMNPCETKCDGDVNLESDVPVVTTPKSSFVSYEKSRKGNVKINLSKSLDRIDCEAGPSNSSRSQFVNSDPGIETGNDFKYVEHGDILNLCGVIGIDKLTLETCESDLLNNTREIGDENCSKNSSHNSGLNASDNLNVELNENCEENEEEECEVADEPDQELIVLEAREVEIEYEDDSWADCEDGSDEEEVCTCGDLADTSQEDDSDEDLPSKDVDLSQFSEMETLTQAELLQESHNMAQAQHQPRSHRKRKLEDDNSAHPVKKSYSEEATVGGSDMNKNLNNVEDSSTSKRHGIDGVAFKGTCTTPSSHMNQPGEKKTPRCVIPTKENPPPEMTEWLLQFQRWSHVERLLAVDQLIGCCEPQQVRHMMQVIEPQFQRDFISLLPRELALSVLSFLEPRDLLRAAQTCRSWRFLADDNLLWKEKCRAAGIYNVRERRGARLSKIAYAKSPWKAAYMRQHTIEMNWRSAPVRVPKVLKGHDDHVITCLQFSGNRIVSGSDDNTLKVWSAITGKCLRTLVGHTGGVWSSQMSGSVIISGSTDRTLKVWDADSGECTHTLYGHTSTVRCMHLHGHKVVSGSRDATLRVWDISHGTCLHVLVGHLAAVRCVQYDGRLVVSGAYDYMVKVWNPEREECLHTLQGHTNRVYSLQFDGIHVVSGSLDTSIRVWEVESGSCKHTLMGHQSLTSGMELRNNILVSGNADSTVKVWDIVSGQCLQTLSGPNKHQSAVTCLQFNSRFVITSSDDGTVKLWDVKTGEFIRNLVALSSGGSGGVVWRIRANETKLICAVGSRNGTEETKLMVLDFDVEGACLKCS